MTKQLLICMIKNSILTYAWRRLRHTFRTTCAGLHDGSKASGFTFPSSYRDHPLLGLYGFNIPGKLTDRDFTHHIPEKLWKVVFSSNREDSTERILVILGTLELEAPACCSSGGGTRESLPPVHTQPRNPSAESRSSPPIDPQAILTEQH